MYIGDVDLYLFICLQRKFFYIFFFLLSEKRYTNSAVVSSQAELLGGMCVFSLFSRRVNVFHSWRTSG